MAPNGSSSNLDLQAVRRESEKEEISQADLWKKIKEDQAANQASTSNATEAFQTARDSISGDETEDNLPLDDSDSDIEIISHANKVSSSRKVFPIFQDQTLLPLHSLRKGLNQKP